MKKMKSWKKWSVIIPVLMAAILLTSSPMSAMAQAEEDLTTDTDSPWRGALAIIAPWKAPVGQEISMRVFLRENQEPFAGAGVWALTRDEAEAAKAEIAALNNDTSIATEEKDYESIADIHGTFIGRTGEDGRLYHAFDEAGVYVLMAARRGYHPGFTPIRIGEGIRALAIKAPEKAMPGEEVLMTVYQRGTEETVANAGIWAVSRENVEALKADITALREDTGVSAEEMDYESVVDLHGRFLGRTDEYGQLRYIFDAEGGYLLIAVHRGYVPGRAPIRIGNPLQALTIWAPLRALVGNEVTMTVYQRGTIETVDNAGIWAITRDRVEALREDIAALNEDSSLTAEEKDYESLINMYGFFLGRTDEYGKLSHTFNEEGDYILVAVKRGYIPGFAPIRIVTLPLTVRPGAKDNADTVTNTRAEALRRNGVQGNGLDKAPGLQKSARLRQQQLKKNNVNGKRLGNVPGLKGPWTVNAQAANNNPMNSQ